MMINRQRLADTFIWLVQIDSVSREEGNLARALCKRLEDLGAETTFDRAHEKIGGETGNLVAKFEGSVAAPPLMLNAHMDTVEPGRGIKPVFADGVFTSDGTTILGADDQSAIAILLEILMTLQENQLDHGPLELVFTVCEEIGLLGAKHLDFDLISAQYGYALDSTDTQGIITRAPAANRVELKVHGRDAHAGAAPEKGINAIWLASKAIAGLTIGRIDDETTCNIGIIQGGKATNIVPDLVTVSGEVRCHNERKLAATTRLITDSFQRVVDENRTSDDPDALPRLDIHVKNDFPRTQIPPEHPVVVLAQQAAESLGRKMVCKTTGGGADANIFFRKGIVTGVIGTGMTDMHSVRESVRLDDMADTAELMIEIIRRHARGQS